MSILVRCPCFRGVPREGSLERGSTVFHSVVCVLVQDGVEFIDLMSSCVPVCTRLLGSKVNTDVLEALEFLATAFEFQVSIKRVTYYIAPSPPSPPSGRFKGQEKE